MAGRPEFLSALFGCKAMRSGHHPSHKTEHDFQHGLGEGGRTRWRCSYCPAIDVWNDDWRWWGSLECRTCGWAIYQAVCCPRPECVAAMAAEFGSNVNPTKRRARTSVTGGEQR